MAGDAGVGMPHGPPLSTIFLTESCTYSTAWSHIFHLFSVGVAVFILLLLTSPVRLSLLLLLTSPVRLSLLHQTKLPCVSMCRRVYKLVFL